MSLQSKHLTLSTGLALLRADKLFVPVYWTNDEDFFSFDAKSPIRVADTEKDELVESLEAPCLGLDFATAGEDGNIYFSSWRSRRQQLQCSINPRRASRSLPLATTRPWRAP